MAYVTRPEEVEWVVNDISELGVKIGDRFFWLYKGESFQYTTGKHDDGTPIRWRRVGKREFGECCHPVHLDRYPERYTEGEGWKDMPQSEKQAKLAAENIGRIIRGWKTIPFSTVERPTQWLVSKEVSASSSEEAYLKAVERPPQCMRSTASFTYQDIEDYWECSACGGAHTFIEGGPKENDCNYCPNCGAKITTLVCRDICINLHQRLSNRMIRDELRLRKALAGVKEEK